MEIREFRDRDYSTVVKWWNKWSEWEPLPINSLPDSGWIISHYGKNLVDGFLYRTDSKMCHMEWIIGDPDADKIQRHDATKELIAYILVRAKKMGFTRVFSSINHKGLMKIYENLGMIKTDINYTNYIGVLE